MDSELIELIEAELDKLGLSAEETKEIKEALAVLPTPGLQTLYQALQLGPIHTRSFFELYKQKKDILAKKDMKAWRNLVDKEVGLLTALI
jgi:hypothetical protein